MPAAKRSRAALIYGIQKAGGAQDMGTPRTAAVPWSMMCHRALGRMLKAFQFG